MSERLIPFDFDAFVREPSRVRHPRGEKPVWAAAVEDSAVLKWANGNVVAYGDHTQWDYNDLRLAAPEPQRVPVRLCRSGGRIWATTEIHESTRDWCSDIVEIEVKEQGCAS